MKCFAVALALFNILCLTDCLPRNADKCETYIECKNKLTSTGITLIKEEVECGVKYLKCTGVGELKISRCQRENGVNGCLRMTDVNQASTCIQNTFVPFQQCIATPCESYIECKNKLTSTGMTLIKEEVECGVKYLKCTGVGELKIVRCETENGVDGCLRMTDANQASSCVQNTFVPFQQCIAKPCETYIECKNKLTSTGMTLIKEEVECGVKYLKCTGVGELKIARCQTENGVDGCLRMTDVNQASSCIQNTFVPFQHCIAKPCETYFQCKNKLTSTGMTLIKEEVDCGAKYLKCAGVSDSEIVSCQFQSGLSTCYKMADYATARKCLDASFRSFQGCIQNLS